MQIIYVGDAPAVDVRLPDLRFVRAERDEPIDLDEAVALSLLEQPDNWQPAEHKKPETENTDPETEGK